MAVAQAVRGVVLPLYQCRSGATKNARAF